MDLVKCGSCRSYNTIMKAMKKQTKRQKCLNVLKRQENIQEILKELAGIQNMKI